MSNIKFTNLTTSTSMQERQIRADVPIPSSNRASKWAFMHGMKHGESFLAYGSAERSAAATYGRTKGWKMVSRIEQELSMASQSMVYRIWKVTQ